MRRSAVEELFVERWDDVVRFVSAFREFEERRIGHVESDVEPAVAAWLAERGFELEVDKKYGEFKAYRTTWVNANGEPVVRLVVGGVFPNGVAKVDCPAPYQWVYLKLDRPNRSTVAEQLRALVGNEWQDDEVNDRGPLGRYLRHAAPDRVQLFSNPQAMTDFVIAKFPDVLALEEVIRRALPSLAT